MLSVKQQSDETPGQRNKQTKMAKPTASKRQVSFRITTSDDAFSKREDDTPTRNKATKATATTTSSERSQSSWNSTGSGGSSVSIPSLGERLIRTQKHRDPLRYYTVLQLLGDGSMGSVSKVRKRTFGGSARQSFVHDERKARRRGCFPCFLFCFPGQSDSSSGSGSGSGSKNSFLSVDKSNAPSTGTNPTESFYDDDDNDDDEEEGNNGTNHSNKQSTNTFSDRARQRREQYKRKASSMISFGTEVSVDFALKRIVLDQCRNPAFQRELMHEVAVLRSLDHPNIVRAIETYDHRNQLFLVLELCSGGDLYHRDPYQERRAASITYSLLDAIAYLHSKGITHRDLKYENIMFASPTSSTVKIIDFGLSKKYGKMGDDSLMNETVGTVYTMAPEVLRGEYDEKCDCWSIGVLAFMLVSSSVPFYGNTRSDVVDKICKGTWDFKGREWKDKSPAAKDFIRSMLVQNASQRPSATQAMEHVWFKGTHSDHDDHDDEPISPDVMDSVLSTIRTFAGYSRLKKLALLVVAHQSIDEEIGYLRRLFLQRFDTDKASPNVSFPEFEHALADYDYSKEELVDTFAGMDVDGTGKISFTEFLAASIESHGLIEEERIAEAFDRIDHDDSGYITVDNLEDILGNEVSGGFLHEIIDEVKTDVHHHISYEDFLGLWDSECDEKLKLALVEVQQRRKRHGGTSTFSPPLPPVGSLAHSNDGEHTRSMDLDQISGYDADTEGGGGHSFFDREKAKSIRGIV